MGADVATCALKNNLAASDYWEQTLIDGFIGIDADLTYGNDTTANTTVGATDDWVYWF